ncbi:MAG: hypothetical protein FJW37_01030 [Acidobacteria bacterium]|nr:hypothetical protein [Acidobacteriota bacterium]
MKPRLALLALAAAAPLAAEHYYLTVTGLAGEPDFGQRFSMWARDIEKSLKAASGARVETLEAPTREALRAALAKIGRQAAPQDALVVMLIGHGTYDGADYRFNLPGPDITAIDLAALLDRVPAARQLVVNMTSASGGSIDALRKENRVLVTATKSGSEKNATVFARYWVEALRDPAVDADKNDTISALEAFRFAGQKTAAYFETQKRLATEHALLEDTGKGEGVRVPSAENGEGLLAGAFPLLRLGAAAAALDDPAKRALLARKEDLEQRIDQLKYRKAALPLDAYKEQLAALLLELARTQEELER